MTITDTGRVEVDEQTLARARAFVADVGGMPSKREMQKHLGKAWPTVNAVLTRLSDEARGAAGRRRQEARRAMRKLSSRKRPGSIRPGRSERQRTVNEITLPVIPTSVSEPEFEVIAEAVEKRPVVGPVSVNKRRRTVPRWPLLLLALPAFVAIWSGWVGLGELTGFGVMHPLPGIADRVAINTAITLPIGLETYAAYALYAWLSGAVPDRARRFARWSAIGSLLLGAGGQVAYHLMAAAGMTVAPWWITTLVSCLPVAVVGMGAALYHLVSTEEKGN
jgi:hypothetical protein